MRLHDVRTKSGWRKMMLGGAFVVFGLAGISLPHAWAQSRTMDDDQPPAEPSGISGEGAQAAYYNTKLFATRTTQPRTTSSLSPRPLSISPDNDFYLTPTRALLAVSRSYYYAGGSLGQPAPPPATPLPVGVAALPWNQGGFKDYDELAELPRKTSHSLPRKYTLEAVPLTQGPPVAQPEAALLVVHLPEHALFWVEGKRIHLGGTTRSFPTPLLRPGGRYSYLLHARWLEDGQWVSQTRTVPVQAGLIEAVYLRSR